MLSDAFQNFAVNSRALSLVSLAFFFVLVSPLTSVELLAQSRAGSRPVRPIAAKAQPHPKAVAKRNILPVVIQTVGDEEPKAVSQASCKNCQAAVGKPMTHSVAQPVEFESETTVAGDEFSSEGFVDSGCDGCDGGSCSAGCGSLFENGAVNCGFDPCSPLGLLSRRLYMRAELASFWASGQFLPTLVSTSDGDPLPPPSVAGVVNADPDRRDLFGGREVGSDTTTGIRYEVGLWFDDCRSRGVLVRLFDTGENDVGLQTDGTRQAVIARNFLNIGPPREQSVVSVAYPNETSGSISANLASDVNGGDLLLRQVLSQDHLIRTDWLMGYQTARLTESLDIVTNTRNLTAPNPVLDQEDHFRVRSQFHGATFGVGSEAREGNWFLGGLFKLAFGNMEQRTDISGFSRTTVGQSTSTQNQGLLARQTNSGTFQRDTFVFVPELGLHLGYRLTHRLDFTLGYSFLRLPKVGRVTHALDRELASNLSDPLTGDVRPTFTASESNLSLHSFNLGLQWAY